MAKVNVEKANRTSAYMEPRVYASATQLITDAKRDLPDVPPEYIMRVAAIKYLQVIETLCKILGPNEYTEMFAAMSDMKLGDKASKPS